MKIGIDSMRGIRYNRTILEKYVNKARLVCLLPCRRQTLITGKKPRGRKKMVKKLKKAFTITELVIVIAVIAILAAVLIPTFTSLIDKANQSSDQSAVRNMNLALQNAEAEGRPSGVAEALEVLNEYGMDAQQYKALASGRKFVYSVNENRVLYVTDDYMIEYPEEYAGKYYDESVYGAAVTLELQVMPDDSWMDKEETGTQDKVAAFGTSGGAGVLKDSSGKLLAAKVAQPGQLVSVMDYISENTHDPTSTNAETEFKDFTLFLSADINLGGAEVRSIKYYDGNFDGNKHTISGIKMSDATQQSYQTEGGSDNYYTYFGFVSIFAGTTFKDVTLEVDIDFPGIAGKGATTSSSWNNHTVGGAIGGIFSKGGVLNTTVSNVTVNGSIVSHSRIGGIVGYVGGAKGTENFAGGSVTITNCKNNADIKSAITEAAGFSAAGGILGNTNSVLGQNDSDTDFRLTISGCVNTGDVTAAHAAGIFSRAYQAGIITISDCTNEGEIYAYINGSVKALQDNDNETSASGIFTEGMQDAISVTISNCYNLGKISYKREDSDGTKYVVLGHIYTNNTGCADVVVLGTGNGTSKDGKSGTLVDAGIAGVTVSTEENVA